jgi:hypothetical protein
LSLSEKESKLLTRFPFVNESSVTDGCDSTPDTTFQLAFSKAEYVGSQGCKSCHRTEYEKWEKSGRANAFDTLVKATRPKNRQYDGECVVCHVVGFGYEKGYADEKTTPLLKYVGCESCHGPCSEHVDRPKDAKIGAMINPHRWQPNETPQARIHRLNQIGIFLPEVPRHQQRRAFHLRGEVVEDRPPDAEAEPPARAARPQVTDARPQVTDARRTRTPPAPGGVFSLRGRAATPATRPPIMRHQGGTVGSGLSGIHTKLFPEGTPPASQLP